ncbi:class I SAM-dependent methyltransferase [Modicisalibacter sp. 'Wilcox']|uniref:class I SAM-dependent methyltransferase n=1 Tax=Modicisalibacter sp. 'Wilcox' TaxID=2679914 RepID=UPI0013D874D2|nr:class I SAM-dependent methyltransferase [Modicisalibacter sp. 'Wilcox']
MARKRKRQPQPRHRRPRQRSSERDVATSKRSSEASTLLGRARTQWLFGEWQHLAELTAEQIAHDVERAPLALLVASAHQQLADHDATRSWARRAIQWGMAPQAVARLLAAGVYNTLGRMAVLRDDESGIARHFSASMQLAALNDTDTATLVRARAGQEAKSLGKDLPHLAPPGGADGTDRERAEDLPPLQDGFYRAFEDRFRGSREEIKRRVRVYLPFVAAVAERHPGVPALDLGCGRGEWLEVLKDAGIEAEGIDQDTGMLQGNRELDLDVKEGEALAYLRQLPDASRISISLMQVVEHIPFDALRHVVQQARRVLVPDGVLIMETPNPENISVGSCNFYMDPTHHTPLPPPLLAFVPEYYGFERVKVLRLQEAPSLHDKTHYNINDILTGVSPDYAVLAQRQQKTTATPAGQEETTAWQANYGISLPDMLQKQTQGTGKSE